MLHPICVHQIDVHEYYKLAVTLLEGDTYALHQLVARLPDPTKRAEFAAHHLALVRRCRAPGQQHLSLPQPPAPVTTQPVPVPVSAPWRAAAATAVGAHVDSVIDATPSSPMPTQGGRKLSTTSLPGQLDTSTRAPVIVWLRTDLRLADNHALHAAAASGRPVMLVYVQPPAHELGPWPLGGATKYWLHHALACFARTLRARYGASLLLYDARTSTSLAVLKQLVNVTGTADVVWNRAYEPWAVLRDNAVDHELTTAGMHACAHICTVTAGHLCTSG